MVKSGCLRSLTIRKSNEVIDYKKFGHSILISAITWWALACIVLLPLGCRDMPEEPWVFVSMPDFLNVDCDYPEPLWEESLSFILESVKSEHPAFLIVPGDLVMGHWDDEAWNDQDSIAKYAERYYTAWKDRMKEKDLAYYVSIGDHEVGDNPWRTEKKLAAVKYYKRAFQQYFQMPNNGPAHMQGTAYWWRHKNCLFISVDVFEEGESDQGLIKAGVTGAQLSWLRDVLQHHDDVAHRVVVGHTPILGPVNTWSSSGLMLEGGRESDFWQLMSDYEIDLYLCGEVHAVTCTARDDVMQVAHGGLLGYNTRTNYLVTTVFDDRLEVTLKELKVTPSGGHKWQTKHNRPLEQISIAEADKQLGFYQIGRVVINKKSEERFLERSGYFLDQYEKGSFRGVPIFKREGRDSSSFEPPLVKSKY